MGCRRPLTLVGGRTRRLQPAAPAHNGSTPGLLCACLRIPATADPQGVSEPLSANGGAAISAPPPLPICSMCHLGETRLSSPGHTLTCA